MEIGDLDGRPVLVDGQKLQCYCSCTHSLVLTSLQQRQNHRRTRASTSCSSGLPLSKGGFSRAPRLLVLVAAEFAGDETKERCK